MIRSPLGLRLDPARPIKDQIRAAASAGARGVVIDSAGDLAPERLSESGRRELRHALRSVGRDLIALGLPTRRPFDSLEGLEDRLARADLAFGLAYDLGTRLVLARVGGLPAVEEAGRREAFRTAIGELGRRAEHRGVRFAIEAGADPGRLLAAFLEEFDLPSLAVSVDPASLLGQGVDPAAATRELGPRVAHAYANEASRSSTKLDGLGARGPSFPAGALDWEGYLGALEEINYRGYLTVWPDPGADPIAGFKAISERLARF